MILERHDRSLYTSSNILDIYSTGSPTRPQIVSPAIGQNRYSYHLEWKSDSQFPILQHRIEYWPQQQQQQQPQSARTSSTSATVSDEGGRQHPDGEEENSEQQQQQVKYQSYTGKSHVLILHLIVPRSDQ